MSFSFCHFTFPCLTMVVFLEFFLSFLLLSGGGQGLNFFLLTVRGLCLLTLVFVRAAGCPVLLLLFGGPWASCSSPHAHWTSLFSLSVLVRSCCLSLVDFLFFGPFWSLSRLGVPWPSFPAFCVSIKTFC